MTVNVVINARNLELSERLRDHVTKKVSKMDRYLDVIEDAKVDLEERTDDMFASVDAVLEKLYRQVERYKGKHWKSRGDGRSPKDMAPDYEPLDTADLTVRDMIVRRKKFMLTPMDELEAVEQMALLDHEDFFVFLNAGTNQVNVLYRRLDGKLGLIESEIA
jgi:putative sigma-54 modulation protein